MAAADGAGLRVRPQIRVQVPERWRRTMPLPLAMLLYGLLLGTGLSSAVPAFAAWGVMVLGVALGNVLLAVVVGSALALGRSLPVLVAIGFDGLETRLSDGASPLRTVRALAALALAVAAAGVVAESAAAALRASGRPTRALPGVMWRGRTRFRAACCNEGAGGRFCRATTLRSAANSSPGTRERS